MGDDNNSNVSASEDSESDKSSPVSSQVQGLRATLQDLFANVFDNPCPRMRIWFHRQSGRMQKLKMIYKYAIQIEVNEGFEQMTQGYKGKVNQRFWEGFSEILQKASEMTLCSKSSFNHEIVKQCIESFRKENMALKEEQKRVEKDSADAMKIDVALSEENHGKMKSLQQIQKDISQTLEVIRDLFNKMPGERDSYELHMREGRKLEKNQAELEAFNLMLRDSREATETLAAEDLRVDTAQVDEEKRFESKLASVKQMTEYLAMNERTLAEMKVTVQNFEARNTEKRGHVQMFEETKTFHEEEMKSKEEILQQAVDYKKKLQDMEVDNECVLEMRDYLMQKKKGIEDDLKALKEEVTKLEEQSAIVDEKRNRLDDLELSLEVAAISQDPTLNRRRHKDFHDDFSSSSGESASGGTFRSLILETPNRTDRDST